MKILWLSHLVPYPPKGGVLQRAHQLIEATAKDHDVYLLAFIQRDLFDIHFPDRATAIRSSQEGLVFCRQCEFIEIPVDRVRFAKTLLAAYSYFSIFPYTINWLQSKEYHRAVAETVARTRFDVVHADTISLVPYLDLAPSTPTTLDHHNVESQMMLRRAELAPNALKKHYFRHEGERLQRYEKEYCAKVSLNLMCSELDATRLAEISPESATSIIPNGVDTEYFKPVSDSDVSTTLIFAGRLSAYTNTQAARFIVSDIWPEVTALLPEISMDLVGHGAPIEATELAARDRRFRVTGFVDDVRDYLNRAAIYVCPIFDGGGTKLKILDAMAMQKAIVATRVACEGIDLVDNESVVFAETGAEYAAAIGRLLSDPGLAARIGQNARRIAVDQYSCQSIGRNLSDIFERLGRPATQSGSA